MKYLSLFRGINVSGKNIIRMEALRKCMENAGYTDVKTYIQSGNVIFETDKKTSAEKVSQELEKLIHKEFGHTITIFSLAQKELTSALNENPFMTERKPEDAGFKHLHIAILSAEPTADNFKKLEESPIGKDEVVLKGKVLYIRFETKQSDSKLSNTLVESRLKVRSTMRNWNTMLKLEELAHNPASE